MMTADFLFLRRKFLIVSGAVVACSLAACLTCIVSDHASPEVKAARRQAMQQASMRLDETDRACEQAIDDHLKVLDQFFEQAKQSSWKFADEALGWESKRRLMWDALPMTEGGTQAAFLNAKFEEHLFGSADLEAAVTQAVKAYVNQLQAVENEMLVRLQADWDVLPIKLDIATLDSNALQQTFRAALQRAQRDSVHSLVSDVGTFVISDISSVIVTRMVQRVLGAVAVRMGVSGGVLGAGASSSWATLGLGLVVAVITDQVISWVWDRVADPRGELARGLNEKLDEIHNLIVEGDGDHPGLRAELAKMAAVRAKLRRQAVLDIIQNADASQPRDSVAVQTR